MTNRMRRNGVVALAVMTIGLLCMAATAEARWWGRRGWYAAYPAPVVYPAYPYYGGYSYSTYYAPTVTYAPPVAAYPAYGYPAYGYPAYYGSRKIYGPGYRIEFERDGDIDIDRRW